MMTRGGDRKSPTFKNNLDDGGGNRSQPDDDEKESSFGEFNSKITALNGSLSVLLGPRDHPVTSAFLDGATFTQLKSAFEYKGGLIFSFSDISVEEKSNNTHDFLEPLKTELHNVGVLQAFPIQIRSHCMVTQTPLRIRSERIMAKSSNMTPY